MITKTKVICDNCGWSWLKVDGGHDLYICHKCYHDNDPNKTDMIKLKDLIPEACWKGYRQFGMKKKGKRQVPNCVPVDEEIVTELGDGSAGTYKWEFKQYGESYQDSEYNFVTDKGTKYNLVLNSKQWVDAELNNIPTVEVEFLVQNITSIGQGYSSKITTNKGEHLKVMSTIVDILKEYIKKNPAVKAIMYSPAKKDNEEVFGTQRDMLYKAFIKKAVPSATFVKEDDYTIAIIK